MNKQHIFHALILITIISMLVPNFHVLGISPNQTSSPQEKAQQLLQKLSPEERVGQLFLAVFKGTDVGEKTTIYQLISTYHIGGVILLAADDNIMNNGDTLTSLSLLSRELQLNRWAASQQTITSYYNNEKISPTFIPLFIGISQEGDGYPYDQILNGLTPIPNEMALGATWSPDLVEQVGNILGKELSILGINLLLGPALDVLETPRPEGSIDLGTRSFGSDPFWVSLLGGRYIRGVHAGSLGRLAVVVKNFPGNGGSDRSPEEEVATVRKSFEQLKTFDLVPFFAVTGDAQSAEETSDGLLASHIRYQGFQANIRVTTRPISFDPQALSLVMQLPALTRWRENGGIIVCDNLGSQAVRRFYDLSGQIYDPRRVALNAYLAGNDLLYLGDMTSPEDTDINDPTKKVIEFFTQKYREDPAFAQQVDLSVLRILTLKYKLYPSFNLNTILPSIEDISQIGKSTQVTFEVAKQAATLISPSQADIDATAPNPPRLDDHIVFFTDVRTAQQCSQCPLGKLIEVNAFEQAIKRLYGPQAGGQVWPANLTSYSYEDLLKYLNGDPNAPPVENSIKTANWIIFAMLNVNNQIPTSQALKRFLSEKPELLQKKQLVVFAFNAPYYLDATNISKLTAYYGLYSKSPIFIEVASRVLFRELLPSGALPVSVPGIGYDLISATSPDPNQTIPLFLDLPTTTAVPTNTLTTEEPTPIPTFKLGDTVAIKTGVIYDHNGHPIPDGTPVQFITSISGETIFPQQETSKSGIATTKINFTSPGSWEIRVESEPAKNSDVLKFEIPLGEGAVPTTTPTMVPTPTVSPSPIPINITPTTETKAAEKTSPYFYHWLLTVFVSIIMGIITYRLSIIIGQVRWGIRSALLAIIGGLSAYCYLVTGLPGSTLILDRLASWGVFITVTLGSALGVLIAWGWRAIILNKLERH